MKEHFWNMFVIDALIGNTDRNNSNWGIILQKDGSKSIAPVYDNGNCLNNKWDDAKMKEVMTDPGKMEAEAYKVRRCIYELHGKRINPYHIIENMEYADCSEAIQRLMPKIGKCIKKIHELIDDISVLSEIQKQFFISMITTRYEKVLFPSLQKIAADQEAGKDKTDSLLAPRPSSLWLLFQYIGNDARQTTPPQLFSRDTRSIASLAFRKQFMSFGEKAPHSPFIIISNACSLVNAFL